MRHLQFEGFAAGTSSGHGFPGRRSASIMALRMNRNMKPIRTVILVLALTIGVSVAGAGGQTAPAVKPGDAGPPDMMIAPPAKPVEKKVSFPMGPGVGQGDKLTIPVTVGKKEYLFLVDTGVGLSVLDSALADSLGELLGPPVGEDKITDIQGRKTPVTLYHPPPLVVAGVPLRQNSNVIAALDLALVREASGRPIQGVLGMDVLTNLVVRLDFKNHQLDFVDAATFTAPSDAGTQKFRILEISKGEPGMAIPFAGKGEQAMALDTGGDFAFTLSADALKQFAGATSRPIWSVGSGGMITTNEYLLAQKWTLAGTTFENLWVEQEASNAMGMAALADFVVTLDFMDAWVYLQPLVGVHRQRGSIVEAFGVSAKEGRFFIKMSSDLAAKLDILPGDEIVALGGKPVEKMELWALRCTIQEMVNPMLTLRRNGANHEVTLHHKE